MTEKIRQIRKPKWRPILHEEQPYEDNYSEAHFLQEGITYNDVIPYDYWILVHELQCVSQELSIVCIFVSIYVYFLNNIITMQVILSLNAILVAIGIFTLPFWYQNGHFISFSEVSTIIGILYLLSPIFKTLTDSTSDDTIIALSIIFLIVHLFTHDYAFVNGYSQKFYYNISLNAVMSVSVLFASRLPTEVHSFAIILFCMLLFLLFPYFRNSIKKHLLAYELLTTSLTILSFGLLASLSWFFAVLYLLTIAGLNFIIPHALLYIQQFKSEIKGPWDVPVHLLEVDDNK
jgi:phosphatidylinositol glycan class C protein